MAQSDEWSPNDTKNNGLTHLNCVSPLCIMHYVLSSAMGHQEAGYDQRYADGEAYPHSAAARGVVAALAKAVQFFRSQRGVGGRLPKGVGAPGIVRGHDAGQRTAKYHRDKCQRQEIGRRHIVVRQIGRRSLDAKSAEADAVDGVFLCRGSGILRLPLRPGI